MEVSLFLGGNESYRNIKNILFDDYLEGIKNGEEAELISKLRLTGDELIKDLLRRVTISGTFNGSQAESNFRKHSGFVCVDIDRKQNPDIDMKVLKLELAKMPFIYAVWVSPSGDGLNAVIRIDGKRHREAFEAIYKYFLNSDFRIEIDRGYISVSKFKSYSFDPDIYINKSSDIWKTYIDKDKIYKKNTKKLIWSNFDVDFILKQLEDVGHSLMQEQDYYDWISLGNSIASQYGEEGEDLFNTVSSYYAGYSEHETRLKYKSFGKRNKESELDFKWFFWYFKRLGLSSIHPDTNTIIQVTNARLRSVGKSGGYKNIKEAKSNAREYLIENRGINSEHVDRVLSQITGLTKTDDDADGSEDLAVLDHYIISEGIKLNTLDKYLYNKDGERIEESEINSIYIHLKKDVIKSIKMDDINRYLSSGYVPSFNPVRRYLDDLVPEENFHFKKMLDIIKLDSQDFIPEDYQVFSQNMILQWFLAFFDSLNGIPSSLTLVLVSPGHGTGKSMFFENLLPSDLKGYLAKPALINFDKDFSLLLGSNLLVLLDDMDISVRSISNFKSITGGDTITVRPPYQRTNKRILRSATLCGTSNKLNIIKEDSNRRIIPICISKIDPDQFKSLNKDKLFANILYYYKKYKKPGIRFDLSSQQAILKAYTKNLMDVSPEMLLVDSLRPCGNYKSSLLTLIGDFRKSYPGYNIDVNLLIEKLRYRGYRQSSGKWNCDFVMDYSTVI